MIPPADKPTPITDGSTNQRSDAADLFWLPHLQLFWLNF